MAQGWTELTRHRSAVRRIQVRRHVPAHCALGGPIGGQGHQEGGQGQTPPPWQKGPYARGMSSNRNETNPRGRVAILLEKGTVLRGRR